MAPLGEDKIKMFKQIAAYSTLGLEMGLSVVVGAVIGYYLDRWLKTDPWFLLIFIFLGAVAGFRSLYRAMKRWERENREE